MEIMDNTNKDIIPFRLGNELSAESFRLTQYNNVYMLSAPRYYLFYASYIRPRMLQYSGWIDGYHNTEHGVIPTYFLQKIGKGISNTVFSRPVVFNTENKETEAHLESKEFKKARVAHALKEAFELAIHGGTSLLKWNKDGNGTLRPEVIPMDNFFVTVDAYGDIESVRAFCTTYHNTINAKEEYHLCEERFYKYAHVGSEVRSFPMVHYIVYKTTSNITYTATPNISSSIPWSEIPVDVKKMIEQDYGNINVDDDSIKLYARWKNRNYNNEVYNNCVLLPFHDDLGCRLIKFTSNIPAFPKMPFGQPLADLLMNESYQYDQLKFFERLEVYISRARAMIDERQANPNDPDSRKNALDPVVFTFYDNVMGETKDGRPMVLQPELRAEAIKSQKQNVLNDTAFALNVSSSTVAAWLSDGTTQKTATEIEYERTKTESFINEKVEIIREPMQEFIDIYFHYYGLTSPELNIMPESQTARSDNIRLFSELYDKGQVTEKMLAETILGTCSAKEVDDLSEFIKANKSQSQAMAQPMAQTQKQAGLPALEVLQ